MNKKTVVFGLLGSNLDGGESSKRWERWRPSVSLCQHDDLIVDRFELLYDPKFSSLCDVVARDIGSVSPETRVNAVALPLQDPWDFEEVYGALLDYCRAYPFNVDREDYLIHITTGTHVVQICLFLLTEARYLPARLLQTSPPRRSRVGRSQGVYEIIDLDLSKYDRIASRFHMEHQEGASFLKSGIATRNKRFNQLIEHMERVAVASRSPILLQGPTGAGKSQLARRIHELKKARGQVAGAFVDVNCATLRGDAAMSALFGHKKGAFTGAMTDRSGLLLKANGGILFLDEIGELGLDEQAMLLRALEEKVFFPLGADEEARSEFQLLAGTNRDLREQVRAGRFRDDLLARINLWTFHLPALKDRREDIEPNLEYELEKFAAQNNIRVTFNKEARRKYLNFAMSEESQWSGNFRDLNASVNRMASLATGGRINDSVVAQEIDRLRADWRLAGVDPSMDVLAELLAPAALEEIDRFQRVQLADVVEVCRTSDSLAQAGRRLFAGSRQRKKTANDSDRLRKYLARFNLTWDDLGFRRRQG